MSDCINCGKEGRPMCYINIDRNHNLVSKGKEVVCDDCLEENDQTNRNDDFTVSQTIYYDTENYKHFCFTCGEPLIHPRTKGGWCSAECRTKY